MDFLTQRAGSKNTINFESFVESEYFDSKVLRQKERKDFLPKLENSQEIKAQNNSRVASPVIFFDETQAKVESNSCKHSEVDDQFDKLSNFTRNLNRSKPIPQIVQSLRSYKTDLNKNKKRETLEIEKRQSIFSVKKRESKSPPIILKKKKAQLNFLQRNQQLNQELLKKWMVDEEIKNQCEKFYDSFVNFLKAFHQKSLQKILKLIEFKTYLKPIFINDQTSIIQIFSEIEFDSMFARAFSLKLYEQFLNERFTVYQIQQFKQAQKLLKLAQNQKDIYQIQQLIMQMKVPMYSEYVKEILLTDLLILADQFKEAIIKKEIEVVIIAGQGLQQTKNSIQRLEIKFVKKLQKEQLQYTPIQKKIFVPSDNLTSFQGATNLSLIENISKVYN